MSLYKSIKNLKTDKRLYTLNVKMGEIDPKSHAQYLQTLEDLTAKSKKLSVEGEDATDAYDDVDGADDEMN